MSIEEFNKVLILVVVEDGLVLALRQVSMGAAAGLNPCCSGRWSRTRNLIKPSLAGYKS